MFTKNGITNRIACDPYGFWRIRRYYTLGKGPRTFGGVSVRYISLDKIPWC